MVGVAAVVLVVVAATFAFVYHSTGSQLEAQLGRSARVAAIQMRRSVTAHHPRTAEAALASARRYAASQPYRNSAVLLFALVPGAGRAANHPELFGELRPDPNESRAVRAEENAEGRQLRKPRLGFSSQPAPDAGPLRLYEVPLKVGGVTAYIGAGEPLASVGHAQEVVRHSFEIAGAIGLVLALLAAYLIGTRVTAPVSRSAEIAARIGAGDLSPRIHLAAGASQELHALAEALNHMLDRLSTAFAAQREFVADASHELRTPLTVLRGQLDVLTGGDRDDGSLSGDELERVQRLMEAEIARLSRLVDDLLLLVQSDRDDFLHLAPVRLDELATELWDGLSLIAERDFKIGRLEPVTVRADPDRLAQALRNLARNAIAQTDAPHGLVQVEVTRDGPGKVRITVSDDGPGIPVELRKRVFERFYRTDKARTRAEGGAGLGLSIVQAIAEAHHGSVIVTDSPAGGAAFRLDLPAT